jgi:hypothetical protein
LTDRQLAWQCRVHLCKTALSAPMATLPVKTAATTCVAKSGAEKKEASGAVRASRCVCQASSATYFMLHLFRMLMSMRVRIRAAHSTACCARTHSCILVTCVLSRTGVHGLLITLPCPTDRAHPWPSLPGMSRALLVRCRCGTALPSASGRTGQMVATKESARLHRLRLPKQAGTCL